MTARDTRPSDEHNLLPSSHGCHGTVVEMTESQFLVWTAQRLQPENAMYRIGFAYTLRGAVEYAPFQSALQTLVNSSDSLRSVVTEGEENPRICIRPSLEYSLPYVDLSYATEPEYHAWARERFRRTRFGPQDAPIDTALVKLAPQTYGWYLCTNHLFTDGWSLVLALKHVISLYEQALLGELPRRVEMPQFQDYVAYENAHRGSDQHRQAEAYWQEKLSRPLERIELYGRLRPTEQTLADRVSVELGAERSRRLMALARHPDLFVKNENVTLFNMFVALLAVYVSRVSDARLISIGSPFFGRPTETFRNTIGLFVEVLPLHVEVQGGDTFVQLIHRVAAEAQRTLRHRQYAVRNPIERPAYEFSVNYPPPFLVDFNGAPVSSYWIPADHQTVSVALTFHDYEGSGNLTVDLDLHCDVFPEARRTEAAHHLLRLLDSFLDNPEQTVGRASLLTAPERHQLLVDFARAADAPLKRETVAGLFEAQVKKHPHHPAVAFEDQSLTYAELDARANQLARHLQKLGVGPETLVGLCVERSPDMIVGLLAILKAGGAYVPLDPTYPSERLAFMLTDSKAPVLLTQTRLIDRLPETDAHVVALDTIWSSITGYAETAPDTDATGKNMAYVIYTSGSTGRPKGVQVERDALSNYTQVARDSFGLGREDLVLQFMSISFDAAGEEIFPCLTSGATLVLRDEGMLASIPVFLDRCRALDLTTAVLPTAFWHQVVTELSPGAPEVPDSLRLLIVGGERILPDRLRAWQEHVGQRVRLINAYGPTEATVVATRFDLTSLPMDDGQKEVPIGRPIRNVHVYVVDSECQPVPVGAPGELCVGGAGVARGYLDRPTLTAQKFVPDPFTARLGSRMYRTGDRARFLPDGNLEFLGRRDHQVKIRGFRVELGAIETVLGRHPDVQDTVVVAREDVPGEKRLVAYVAFGDQAGSVSTLRDFVRQRLPAYMVPSAFVSMEALPLTPSGKVDRRALPEPDLSRAALERDFAPPRGEIGRKLVEIWEKLLDVRPIGVRDDFFELGGHSLLAVRLAARVEESFGVNIPLTTIFQEPTIERLTRHVAWQQGTTIWPPLVPIQPRGPLPPFFCVHPLCGDVVSFTIWSRYLGDDQPFYGFRARGLDGVQDPVTEVEAIAADYVQELRNVEPQGPYYLGGYAGGGVIAFEMAQQLLAQEENVALLLVINEPAPNSGYRRFSLRPRTLAGFFANLPHWLHDFLRLRMAQLAFRFQLRLRSSGFLEYLGRREGLGRRLQQAGEKIKSRSRQLIDEHNRALLDRDNVPRVHDIRQQRIAKLHLAALRRYKPRPYPGSVTVFRTRRQPLFCSFDPELGWWELAEGGVDIRTISGSTPTVLKDPHAQTLAEELRSCLAKARRTHVAETDREKQEVVGR